MMSMEAIISGESARAAFVQGTEIFYIEAERPEEKIYIDQATLPLLFRDATDVEVIKVDNYQQSFNRLLHKFNVNRALIMLDLALDFDANRETRIEAAREFVIYVKENDVYEAVKNCTLSVTNDRLSDIEELRTIFFDIVEFVEHLIFLNDHQFHIMDVQETLQKSLDYNATSSENASLFLSRACSISWSRLRRGRPFCSSRSSS